MANTGTCQSFPIPTQNSVEMKRAYYFPGFTCRIKRKEGNRYRSTLDFAVRGGVRCAGIKTQFLDG
jgi:hypothetical protein